MAEPTSPPGSPSGALAEPSGALPAPTTRHARRRATRLVVVAALTSAALAAAKLVASSVTGSATLLAEGLHSLAAAGTQVLLLLGGRRARRAAHIDHPLAYGREHHFWAFAVGLVLLALAAAAAVHEGLHAVRQPVEVDEPGWAFGVLGAAVVLVSVSVRGALAEARALRGGGGYRELMRRAKVPEVPVVLLQGVAGLVGLALALAAVGASVLTGDGTWDGYGALAIGTLLGATAVVLAAEMKSLLIGDGASSKQDEAIRAAIRAEPSVLRLIHLRAQHLGPEELLIGAKVEFLHDLTLPEVAAAVNRVEGNVRANVPHARIMYIEPDVADERRAGPLVAEHEANHLSADELADLELADLDRDDAGGG